MALPAVVLQQTIGSLECFDPNGSCTFSQWVARFNLFCDGNFIQREPTTADGDYLQQPNRRRNVFLTMIGARAFTLVYNACLPNPPEFHSIPQLVECLQQHFEPVGMVEANRLSFHQRAQMSSESVFEYVNILQAMAGPCQFGPYYDQAMISRLIAGIRHNDTRQKLLTAHNLTWAGAKELAMQDDAVRTQMRTLAQAHSQAQARVNAVFNSSESKKNFNEKNFSAGGNHNQRNPHSKSQPASKPPGNNNKPPANNNNQPQQKTRNFKPCFRCGRKHNWNTCPAKNWVCKKCNQIGHIAPKCGPGANGQSNSVPVNQIFEGNDEQLVDHLIDQSWV